jgi:tight adherence protein C
MFELIIMVCGAAATLLLAPRLVAPFASRTGAEGTQDSLLLRVGQLLCNGINRSDGIQSYMHTLDTKLHVAGRRGTTGETFLTQAEGAGVLALIATLVLCTSVIGFGPGVLVVAAMMGGITTWLLLARADNWIAERRRDLERQFPYFLDLAVMTMDSGTGMLEVIAAYVSSAPDTALAQELSALTSDINMGTTVEAALLALEARIPSQDVTSVTRAIRQGLRMGTPLAQVFREQAETMRFRRSQHAERSAEELKVRLQGPAMMLVMAVLILVLGPAFVGMSEGGV